MAFDMQRLKPDFIRLKWILHLIVLGTLLVGCMGNPKRVTPIDSYRAGDIDFGLRSLAGEGAVPIAVENFTAFIPREHRWACRMYSFIWMPGGQPVEFYLRDAIRSELRDASLYDDTSVKRLRGHIHSVSMNEGGIGSGAWTFTVDFSWSDGDVIPIEHLHSFPGQFMVDRACSTAAHQFVPAVQGLIRDLISHPLFKNRLRNTERSMK